MEVLGGRHGDEVVTHVDAALGEARPDGGEPLGEEVAAEVAAVEEHVVGTVLLHLRDDVAGDDVAGSEFREFVAAHHEALAVRRSAGRRPRRAPPRR